MVLHASERDTPRVRVLRRAWWRRVRTLDLPPYSPDLDPMEPCWSKVEEAVRARRPGPARGIATSRWSKYDISRFPESLLRGPSPSPVYSTGARPTSVDREAGECRRHHLHESVLQRAMKAAVRAAGIPKSASCHTSRHACATHLLEDGYDIRTSTTMTYTHVLNRGGRGVRSPLD